MLIKKMLLLSAGFVFTTFINTANATMRCGTSLISEGDSISTVLEKCGQPLRKSSEGPAKRPNGVPRLNAATITIFVYGPNGGSYQYLRFIDDKLIEIDMRRE
ncbi:hypothetical protein ALO43_200200 [Pseudomonas tremae]|uniref:DUF2845 domain-containing protein n=5 Tax=Pseudomonas TaxID=286 RepID=A0AAE6QN72_9PSED|nr:MULTISPECIES: DUF2845 domain-containing protein [Pseudomonas syringae group]RMR95787.1 hypothetical protein ALP74_200456 [Pseudomonas coronafaciens pv. garcae]KPZ00978.1 hypothetical protein ALO43_200200 [Pseudomonas tremae]QGT84813.1 DUF2845 domain-containing protein [Pseudomonas coronafaciens pv. coronafaciens]RMM77136.1 hypothetical protein ALQ71_00447 [Pseudomonas coronafaciens pv. striafaciens]RMN90545.1 hypothetical protein ALQ50_200044 [Pseudomonas coronafaciens pv. coronafaciens]